MINETNLKSNKYIIILLRQLAKFLYGVWEEVQGSGGIDV